LQETFVSEDSASQALSNNVAASDLAQESLEEPWMNVVAAQDV
jgi:hypothetical protein